jgi:hypothetical protein
MAEFKKEWELLTNRKKKLNNSKEVNYARDFVSLIYFYLRNKSKQHIRNVIYQGIMDWEVLILFGKMINHEVKLPENFEKNETIKKVISLDLTPIST